MVVATRTLCGEGDTIRAGVAIRSTFKILSVNGELSYPALPACWSTRVRTDSCKWISRISAAIAGTAFFLSRAQ